MTEAQKRQLDILYSEYNQIYRNAYACFSAYVRIANPELAEAKWGKSR